MQYFETHHVTIDLNELDPQSTLSTTDWKSLTNKSGNYSQTLTNLDFVSEQKKTKDQDKKLQLSNIIASIKDKKLKEAKAKYDSPVRDFIRHSLKEGSGIKNQK